MAAVGLHEMLASIRLKSRQVPCTVDTEECADGEEAVEIQASGLDQETFQQIYDERKAIEEAEADAIADTPEELLDQVTIKTLPGQPDVLFGCGHYALLGARAPETQVWGSKVVDFEKHATEVTRATPRETTDKQDASVEPTGAQPAATEETVPALNVVLQSNTTASNTLTAEETHLKRWYEESFVHVDEYLREDEPFEMVQCDKQGHRVVVSQQRLEDMGIAANGRLRCGKLAQDAVELYWIQDKPAGYKDKYGRWDPVNAQWKLFPERTVVPIEQRIAPLGKGYGGAECGREMVCNPSDTFTFEDYGDESQYTDTALEPGLPHILDQIEALGEGVALPVANGWAVNPSNHVAYYTPQLRHVQIDTAVGEAAGKKYVYGFYTKNPVRPIEGEATWDATNSVWAFPIDACHKPVHKEACCEGCPMCSERGRDGDMSGK